ncbi:hypothetical protein OAL43_03070, partial [bacterium]|nr:hypothetical protein [bacterium]
MLQLIVRFPFPLVPIQSVVQLSVLDFLRYHQNQARDGFYLDGSVAFLRIFAPVGIFPRPNILSGRSPYLALRMIQSICFSAR